MHPPDAESHLLAFRWQRDLGGFRRSARSACVRTVSREPDSCQEGPVTRRAAAFIVALALTPAVLHAQDTALTITVQSADVHKAPSNVTPVVGHVAHGTVLPIARNLGSWVKVAWPDAPDGFGYVHVSMGRIAAPNGAAPAASASPRAASAPAPAATTTIPPVPRPAVAERVAPRRQPSVTPESHVFGVGGLLGSTSTFGATARAWRDNHLGIQIALTRDAMNSGTAAGRVTSMQFEPGVVYALVDRVSDYVWMRPYVGSSVSFRHQTLSVVTPVALEPVSDNGVGFRFFGGSEFTFASVPRFGLSADLGYHRLPTPFPGFDASGPSISIAGHWYIK
jgi:hypothetical protein